MTPVPTIAIRRTGLLRDMIPSFLSCAHGHSLGTGRAVLVRIALSLSLAINSSLVSGHQCSGAAVGRLASGCMGILESCVVCGAAKSAGRSSREADDFL